MPGGRPRSMERQRKIAAVVEMNADGKRKGEIAAALGISNREVSEFLADGLRVYVERPTRAALNQHRERLEAILESLEAQAMRGKLFHIDRYLQVLDRLGAITGVNWVDRAKTMAPDHGAEIDLWLRGSVEHGGVDSADEAEILTRVVVDEDDIPVEITPESLDQDLDSGELDEPPPRKRARTPRATR